MTTDELKQLMTRAAATLKGRMTGRPTALMNLNEVCGTCRYNKSRDDGTQRHCGLVGKKWSLAREVRNTDPACGKHAVMEKTQK